MALIRASKSSGGSSIATGEISTIMTASETKAIDTGLSTIKRFTLVGWITSSTNTISAQCLTYDKDYSSNTYSSYEITAPTTTSNTVSGYGATQLSFGGSINACFVIVSISGGTVTIKAPSATQYSTTAKDYHLYWYAE